MEYANISRGIFLARPNRFLAQVTVNGEEVLCHVRNTGRCKELLVPGAQVVVCQEENPNRKTRFSLLSVYKGKRLINMDSQAPNQVAREWLEQGGLFPPPCTVRPEVRWGDSRFDFMLEKDSRQCFVEVKGVTLEQEGTVLFPDAPTLRGARHLRELARCAAQGIGAAVLFVVQMENVRAFRPNQAADPAFAQALRAAAAGGVRVLAYDCHVTEESLRLGGPVPVELEEDGAL